jgi:ATP-binding cassette, subfamily B, bacterial
VFAKLQELVSQLSYISLTLRLIWTATRNWTLAWACLLVLQGILPAAPVYLSRLLVDGLVHAIETSGSWESIRPVVFWAALIAGALLLIEVIEGLSAWVRTVQVEFIRDHLSALIQQQAVAVDLAFYESSDYHDRLERARSDLQNRPLALLENAGSLLQNTITLVAMGSLLLPYGMWLPIVLFVSTLPALYVVIRFNLRYHHWWEQTTSDRRWAQYYEIMVTHSEVAAELRLFDLGAHFQSAFQAVRHRLRTEQLQFTKKQSLARLSAGFVGILISGLAMVWMVWRALQGLVTLGDLALFQQAFQRGQTLMRHLLENVGRIYSNSLFLGNLFEFLNLRAQVTDSPRPLPVPAAIQEGMRFEQVTFRYPGSERIVLQDFNLTIPAGQIVAIVGTNGSGKSTLIKLLCRFYDPEAGRITLDGIDLRDLSLTELRRSITVLFQCPVNFLATAAESIALGDIRAAADQQKIEAAARGSGAHEVIARLPQGYDTLLGRWFPNGTGLSGGEWQRMALARAFFRQSPFVILDEPTSFMDSWAEAEWLKRFRTLVQGRTALVITHRFTTAMQADVIHVMDQGRIVESGTHETLLAGDGPYAKSWMAQMQAGSDLSHSNSKARVMISQADPVR